MAGQKRSRRFLEGVRSSFLLQALEGPAVVMHRWISSSLTGQTWLWDVVIDGGFGCGDCKTAGFKTLKAGRKESSGEEVLDFRRALRFCSKMTAGMLRGAAVRAKGGQEEKQMSVCRGRKPTTTPLTFLIMHEFMEERNSTRSLRAYLFLGRAEKEEMPQQLSQDWDLDVSIADRAACVLSKAVPSLGEGGRTAEGLRAGSW